jgi:tetratricopeptide (TPR) repeat protein
LKNIKHVALSIIFVLLASPSFAQTPELPALDGLPDDQAKKDEELLDPLFDTPVTNKAPTPPANGNKEILNKAIDEVFEDPTKGEAKPAAEPVTTENTAPQPAIPAGIDEASAPPIPVDEDPILDPTLDDPKTEAPAPTAPALPAVENTPAQPKAEEVKIEEPKAEEPKVEEPKAEEKPKEVEAPAVTEEKKAPVKKAKAKKKLSLPKQTPRSLREDYREPDFNSGSGVILAPTQPTITPGFPPNTRPINGTQMPSLKPSNNPLAPPELTSENSSDLEDDISVIQEWPSKKKALKLDESKINIDRSGFNDPFADKTQEPEENTEEVKAITDNQPLTPESKDTSEVPVVDLSETASLAETTVSKKSTPSEDFYMEDSDLSVEVKDAPKSNLGNMKNAYEALRVGQYESAIKYYNEVLADSPNNNKALFGIATAYQMSKENEKAKETYLKIIQNSPDFWPAVNNYIILITEENPDKSIPKLEELYSRNPTFAAIPAQLGNLYYKKGDVERSIEYYINAVTLEPKNIEYRYNLALIFEKSSRKEDAAALYKTLLDDAAKGAALPESTLSIKNRYEQLIYTN